MAHYVYLLASKKHGTLYLGVTNDLVRRVYEHRSKAVQGFTARYGVDKLVWFEIYDDAITAIAREKVLKKWRRDWNIRLIEEEIPAGSIFIRVSRSDIALSSNLLPLSTVIPGRRGASNSESITTIVSMDSGLAPRGRAPE
jgi:putative endonuclease